MDKLQRSDLYSLENYAAIRNEFRSKVMQHKKHRSMLRIEKIFEADGIEEELQAYNPLIPDGQNLKAVMMIEFSDVNERKGALEKLIGIDRNVWLKVDGFAKVSPISNEDLDRETEEKTSSVHFMRFEFTPEMITAMKNGASVSAGVEHPEYQHELIIDENVRQSLADDFD
jgi:hypothetical protein